MKTIALLCCFFIIAKPVFGLHGVGGTLTYQYLGNGAAPSTEKYRVTVKHYIDCNGTQFIEGSVFVGIFDGTANTLLTTLTITETSRIKIERSSFTCITSPPEVCYVVVSYVAEVELPHNTGGYVLSEQECCRINNIINIQNSGGTGLTSTNTIPGVINSIVYRNNSSPEFSQKDTAVICFNQLFSLDFSAQDREGDSLAYAFCPGKAGGSGGTRQPNPPSPPPYADIIYLNGYSANEPLGSGVTINSKTGLISGIAPGTLGSYIIAVSVNEYRGGVLIGTTKKEFQVNIADCNLSVASLKSSYVNCTDFSFSFKNEMAATNISSYYWDFGVTSSTTDISTAATPAFTYPDTGVYVLKLKVFSTSGCEDSITAPVSVFPGFTPDFTFAGSCAETPFQFTDVTQATYGSASGWTWNFSDGNSILRNPSYQFNEAGIQKVTLIATSNKGCVDSVSKTIVAAANPMISMPFRDTLICSIDTLVLQSTATGNFSWTTNNSMLFANTNSPLIFPKDTSIYVLTVNNNGCIDKDSIQVNVLGYVTVSVPADTVICKSDNLVLRPTSDALQYTWVPGTGLSDAEIKDPVATPATTITYKVIANLGKCQAEDFITVKVVPYPYVDLGADTAICYAAAAQLNANIIASSFNWSPLTALQNYNTVSPVAKPLQTTSYSITVYDTLGCPKPSFDTVVVTVKPRIIAFAGSDTLVVVNQPLQLNASGGTNYSWSPPTGLNNTTINNPIAVLDEFTDFIYYKLNVEVDGCFSEDEVIVRVFKTGADILVPTGFTPNKDGKNDVLKPILIGMKSLESFKIFNRWGQMVFKTNTAGKGWDGTLNGKSQASGTFVFVAEGTNYLNQKIVRKGTVALIR
jgi:gliding motility-associated-like protein